MTRFIGIRLRGIIVAKRDEHLSCWPCTCSRFSQIVGKSINEPFNYFCSFKWDRYFVLRIPYLDPFILFYFKGSKDFRSLEI